MIPKIIYMCYKDLEIIQKYSENWKILNPDYEIKLYDDELCEKFLLEEFSELHRDIFKFIKDGPIKSHFWRVCIIYKYGGLYVDADIEPLVPLNEYIEPDVDFVTCISGFKQFGFNPHFIMAKPNNEILKKCIDTYIQYFTDKKEYSYCDWSICPIFLKFINIETYSSIIIINEQKYQLLLEEFVTNYQDTDNFQNHFCKYKKIKIFNNRYKNYISHNFYDTDNLQIYEKPTSIQTTKIAITFDIPKNEIDIFSNGIKQNCLFFYELLENIGYDVYLIINDSDFKYTNNLNFWNKGNIKYTKLSQVIKINPHIVFQFGFQIEANILNLIKAKNIKTVNYVCGNKYFMESEFCLYGNNDNNDFQYNQLKQGHFDEIWLIPQHINSSLCYLKTFFRTNVIEVPFIWSPSIIDSYSKALSNTNLFYKNRGKQKKISIFEPNMSIIKWALPCVLICENAERTISEKELIKHVYVTNVNSQNNPNYKFNFTLFNRILSSLDLFKKSKLSVESRYNSLFFMSQYSDIAVSHQMENNLNYLYLDLAWMGWPIVHNANLCKDVGYYYEGFNYDEGAEMLKKAILTHDEDSNSLEYLKRNRAAINRYIPTNKYLQEQYKNLINKLL
jgi:hypothetical protein